jgi:hypothetical protein
MRIRITTQNGLPPVKTERDRKLLDWTRQCEELEAELGKPSPDTVQLYAKRLEAAELSSEKDYSTVIYRKWPTSRDALRKLLNELGSDVIAVELADSGLLGVVYV